MTNLKKTTEEGNFPKTSLENDILNNSERLLAYQTEDKLSFSWFFLYG